MITTPEPTTGTSTATASTNPASTTAASTTAASTWRNRFAERCSKLRPKTVRLRLTLLCGSVVLLSGAGLLALTFLLGSRQSVGSAIFVARGPLLGLPGGSVKGGAGQLPVGTSGHASGQIVRIASAKSASGGGLTIEQARIVAQVSQTSAVHNLLMWSGIALGVVTVLGLALGFGIAGRMLRPLRTMTQKTQRISEDNLHERLAIAGPAGDELKDLGDTIDDLLGRLEAAFEAQRRFVQNASHELRTPIAMMRTSLDVATGKPGGVREEVTRLAGKLREGLDQAERLLESFLVLARAQDQMLAEPARVDLAECVADAVALQRGAAARQGIAVHEQLAPAPVRGSGTLLARLVANLVDNAVRHNQAGGWVSIATAADAAVASLVVENGGPLLDADRVRRLGRPFERLAADRTASEHGVGLGLSIVAAIAKAHGGTLALAARPEGGLRAEVRLPAEPEPAAALAGMGT